MTTVMTMITIMMTIAVTIQNVVARRRSEMSLEELAYFSLGLLIILLTAKFVLGDE